VIKTLKNIAMEEEKKKVSITGKDCDEKVVKKQEISEDDLNAVAGGDENYCSGHCVVVKHRLQFSCNPYHK
jgi:hypothetical protein